jgi:hypothetical protein
MAMVALVVPNAAGAATVATLAAGTVQAIADPGATLAVPADGRIDDGSALNVDGTWKHGGRALTNVQKQWLTSNGWSLP